MQTKEQTNEIDKLAEALAKCQGEMEGAKKDATNPFFKKNYSDLASCWASARKPLSSNGLSVVQTLGTVKDQTCVITYLLHKSGQFMKSILKVIPPKTDMQSLGAAISYARRYSFCAIVGIYQVDLDDDGNGNGNGHTETQTNKILTDKEKAALSKEILPKDQDDIPLGPVPEIKRDKFITSDQATAYRKECVRLKIPTKTMKAELKEHGISMPDKIPADEFDTRFKELEFLANEEKKEVKK